MLAISGKMAPSELQRAYAGALSVCMAAACLAVVVWAFGFNSRVLNIVVAGAIGISGIYAGIRLISSGCSLGALPYFLIGAGTFFGFGTIIATQTGEVMSMHSFTHDVQRALLGKLNAANAVAIATVVVCAGPFIIWLPISGRRQPGLVKVIESLQPNFRALLFWSTPIVVLIWVTFPVPSNLLLASLLALLQGIPFFTIILGGAIWHKISGLGKMLLVAIVLALCANGALGLSKLAALLPPVVLGLGWWLGGRMRKTALALFAGLTLTYFGGFAELVTLSRFHVSYDPVTNSAVDRVGIISDSVGRLRSLRADGEDPMLLQRFTLAPFQAYFMNLYDSGAPGDTFENIPVVLVPRVLWPDKPIITPGAEFDLIFRGYESESNLGIGFVSEAYWNLGWTGVILVSIFVGLTNGWFTRKWLLFAEQGDAHLGAFLFSPLVVFSSLNVEKSIVGGFTGGMVKLAIAVIAVDLVCRMISTQRALQRTV